MQLLIAELRKHFEVDLWEPEERNDTMSVSAILYAVDFNNYLVGKEYDAVVIRADRYELLPIAVSCAYSGLTIIHLEGGDESGVIDNRVRHAITALSDYHFCTNEESHRRLIQMGVPIDRVWNYGSLDVEYARQVEPKRIQDKKYLLIAYHPIENEDEKQLDKALDSFPEYAKISTRSNKDYGREYGTEQFPPPDYINLLRYAEVCIGNSSSLLKEVSILGTPVVLVGDRQHNRFSPANVLHVPCETQRIVNGIKFQLENKYEEDLIYYKPLTSVNIAKQLQKIL